MSGGDLDAYVERAVALLSNEEARRQAAAAQTRRVGELYSARSFVRNLCELGLELAKA
jgi:predicted O-linked N-acetylglucosamine transferase (SPINDLY family)